MKVRGSVLEPHWSYGLFVDLSIGTSIRSSSLVLMEHRKDMNNVGCHCDTTSIINIVESGIKHLIKESIVFDMPKEDNLPGDTIV